jgi:hypothetical protein
MAPVDPPGGQPIAAPIAAVINGPIVFTSTLSGEARAISSPNRADTPADRRIHNHAVRGARCAVRGARCVQRAGERVKVQDVSRLCASAYHHILYASPYMLPFVLFPFVVDNIEYFLHNNF